MRIAVWHNLPSGGGKRALHDHVRGLVGRGHEVESWSPPTADLVYMPLSRFGAEHVLPFDFSVDDLGNRLTRRLWPYQLTVARIEAMKRHARRCVEAIEGRGFDLIFGNTCSAFATPFLARFATIPTVLYLQDPYRPLYEANLSRAGTQLAWVAEPAEVPANRPSLKGWKGRADRFVKDLAANQAIRIQASEEALNVHAFDRALCNSRFSRESFAKIYGRNFRVCYLGVDVEAFRRNGAAKERFVVGLGSFGFNKGIDIAIRAVATIEPSGRPDLVWIGNFAADSYYEEVTALAANLGVNFIPKKLVGQDTLVDLLGRAAVMICTSRLEPFGYAPLEANACGTAVVGVAEGGVRETIEPDANGFLIDDDDPVALGRAISRYTGDLDFAKAAGIRAHHHFADRWRVEPAIDRLEAHLEETLRGGRLATAGRGV